jgi:galactan endo-1,6-beta-galactosidase
MDELGLKDMPIAASDETAYDAATATWRSFSPEIKALVGKVNVHGYQHTGGRRDVLHALVSKDDKVLWNSEYGENDGTGLTLAHCLDLDFRYLHPTAWCYWQAVCGGGWGLVKGDLSTEKVLGINPKYFVVAQYTRHIRPGMTILETGDTDTVAAYDAAAHKLVLVVRADQGGAKTIELGKFASATGPVTRWITEPKGTSRYEMHRDVTLSGKQLVLTLPANSVQTFEIENVTLP